MYHVLSSKGLVVFPIPFLLCLRPCSCSLLRNRWAQFGQRYAQRELMMVATTKWDRNNHAHVALNINNMKGISFLVHVLIFFALCSLCSLLSALSPLLSAVCSLCSLLFALCSALCSWFSLSSAVCALSLCSLSSAVCSLSLSLCVCVWCVVHAALLMSVFVPCVVLAIQTGEASKGTEEGTRCDLLSPPQRSADCTQRHPHLFLNRIFVWWVSIQHVCSHSFECTLDFNKWIRGGRYPGLFHHNDKVIIRPFVCCACAISHIRELFAHTTPPPNWQSTSKVPHKRDPCRYTLSTSSLCKPSLSRTWSSVITISFCNSIVNCFRNLVNSLCFNKIPPPCCDNFLARRTQERNHWKL